MAYVRAAKRGQQSGGIDTIRYVLYIGLTDRVKPLKLLETRNFVRMRKKLLAVRQFLDQDLDKPLDIKDETTRKEFKGYKEEILKSKRAKLVPVDEYRKKRD